MPLVELCFPDGAGPEIRSRALSFCETLEKTAVEVPDEAGFVVNRLLFPYLFDAVRLLERTGLEPAQIDTCMKLGVSHPMGPLELLDLVGLDVAESIGEALHADSGDPGHRPPGRIKSLIRVGRLGRKSGAGFHDYS
jgi:3-hydroxyacyl-CoA dehydrogenase